MKQQRILLSQDGPHNNIIKFKPPMCFSKDNVDSVISKLDVIFTDVEQGAADLMAFEKPAHALDIVAGSLMTKPENGDEPAEKRPRLLGGGIDTSTIEETENGHGEHYPQTAKVL
jgi:hypothetical protein